MLLETKNNRNPSFCWVRQVKSYDGVTLRTVYWPSWRGADNLGTVCILQGRAECIEKYYETVQDLLERGFAVLAFDWRGQGGSERLLDDPGKGHVDDFIEYQYDLLSITRKFLPLTPKPHFCLAYDIGGTIALEATLRGVSPFDRQVLVSPLIEYTQDVVPKLGSAATWVGKTLGYGEEDFTGNSEYFLNNCSFTGNHFTSDERRYERWREIDRAFDEKSHNFPAVQMPTFSWMQAAHKQMNRFFQSDFAEKMTTPTVAISGGCDRICMPLAMERLLSHIKVAQTLLVRGARHDLLNERDTYRRELWAALDVFIPGEQVALHKKVA